MTISLEDFSAINLLMDERDAARILSCSAALLRKWRFSGKGPAFCKVGRLVRYSQTDLASFLNANRIDPTGGAR